MRPIKLDRVSFERNLQRGFVQHVSGAELLVIGLFGNIRSMTPLLVVSPSQDFLGSRAENMEPISVHSFLVV